MRQKKSALRDKTILVIACALFLFGVSLITYSRYKVYSETQRSQTLQAAIERPKPQSKFQHRPFISKVTKPQFLAQRIARIVNRPPVRNQQATLGRPQGPRPTFVKPTDWHQAASLQEQRFNKFSLAPRTRDNASGDLNDLLSADLQTEYFLKKQLGLSPEQYNLVMARQKQVYLDLQSLNPLVEANDPYAIYQKKILLGTHAQWMKENLGPENYEYLLQISTAELDQLAGY